MTAKLTSKQESFIKLMTKSEEHARHGFDLLLQRPGLEEFFDALQEAGLFEPINNPAPVPAEEPGFSRIPYWHALNYLVAVATKAGEENDIELAQKVMTVVRSVGRAREPDGSIRDNYHTHHNFARILGLVPTVTVVPADLALIPDWLTSKFDRGMVGRILGEGALHRFLASGSQEDCDKACLILKHCTDIYWVGEHDLGPDRKKPITVVEDHWLRKLIEHNAKALGARAGRKAADILLFRIRDVFTQGGRQNMSWLWRPAIEDHPQNHEWHGPENRFVEGLRDILLAWIDHDPNGAQTFVKGLLSGELEIIRRIGIHVLTERWGDLRGLYQTVLGPGLFDTGHLHELYHLLHEHFDDFSEAEKEATIEAIRQLPELSRGENPGRQLRYIQRNWLRAVVGKGYETAESWFKELVFGQELSTLREHPDFHSYVEFTWGFGSSPYHVQELVAFAEDGTIVERLNAFRQPNSWRGPTTRSLVDTIEEAVNLRPLVFLSLLAEFLNARRPFQHAVISGFKRLWEEPEEPQQGIEWGIVWSRLVWFFEQLIVPFSFWAEETIEEGDVTPDRDWIPPLIAEFLHAGTKNDKKSYSPDLFPRTWALIEILLENSKPLDEPGRDAMFQAINSPKGKAIEALFSHALRVCRLSDRESGGHTQAWAAMRPAFDRELAKCRNSNYEFSTLAGSYIIDLQYIDPEWLRNNIALIFPDKFATNCACAIEGLAYARAARPVYSLMVESGVMDRVLRQNIMTRNARQRVVEWIALVYLWGDEELDSPRFSYFFEEGRTDDLEDASDFFSDLRNPKLPKEQGGRILQFWDRCVSWSLSTPQPPAKLLSSLSHLTCYLDSVSSVEKNWLLAVAPHVQVGYNTADFIEELDRLADISPSEVCAVLRKVLETYLPSFDFEDRLKSLLSKLVKHGRREEVLSFTERLRHLPGIPDLYNRLTS